MARESHVLKGNSKININLLMMDIELLKTLQNIDEEKDITLQVINASGAYNNVYISSQAIKNFINTKHRKVNKKEWDKLSTTQKLYRHLVDYDEGNGITIKI